MKQGIKNGLYQRVTNEIFIKDFYKWNEKILASKPFHILGNALCEPLKNFPFPLTLLLGMTGYHIPCLLVLIRFQHGMELKEHGQ